MPPAPGSSRAAHQAALQRYLVLSYERRDILYRLDVLRRGAPNPRPMPPPTPPVPPEVSCPPQQLLQRTGPSLAYQQW
ncbi:hypothetical protein ABPG75_011041 [Micractinium tetrahymenae]